MFIPPCSIALLVLLLNNSHPFQTPLNFVSTPAQATYRSAFQSSYSHVRIGLTYQILIPTIVELQNNNLRAIHKI